MRENRINPGEIVIVGKGERIIVNGKNKRGRICFIPILYLIKSKEKLFGYLIPTPAICGKGRGWDLPLYHFAHPLSKNYLLPFLWVEYPEEFSWVFNIHLPYPKEYVKHEKKYYSEGFFTGFLL